MPRPSLPILLLACGACLAWVIPPQPAAAQPAAAAGQAQQLVPANFNNKTDSRGMNWDIQPSGIIGDGTTDCFDNAHYLSINGQPFGGGQPMMTADGSEFVLSGQVAGLNLTRRIKIDSDRAAARYVEVLENPTGAPVQATLSLQTNLGSNCQNVTTDTGRAFNGTFEKDEAGVIAEQMPGSRPSVVFLVRSPGAKFDAAVSNQGNRTFNITYTLTVPARGSVAVTHATLQRTPGSLPKDAKALQKEFAPILKDRKYLADLPREVRRALQNWRAGVSDSGAPALFTMLQDFEIDPEAAAGADILAIGTGTRLRGSLKLTGLQISTNLGEQLIPPENVAGIAGHKARGDKAQVYLRDGQVLIGKLAADEVAFQMTTGLVMPLSPQTLDRVLRGLSEGDGEAPTDAAAMLDTVEGNRVALRADDALRMPIATAWGERDVPLKELLWVRVQTGEQTGYRARLRDGSRFVCFLDGSDLAVNTLLFGPASLSTTQVRWLTTELAGGSEEKETATLTTPYLNLVNEQVLVGTIAAEQIELLTVSGAIPLPPAQVKSLRNVTDEAGPIPGEGGAVFAAELWGGGTAVGRLSTNTLPVKMGDSVWNVPATDVVEFIVPTPQVTAEQRANIALLIRDLGDAEWSKRESATKELQGMGVVAAAQLREAAEQSEDEEIKRRAELILDAIE